MLRPQRHLMQGRDTASGRTRSSQPTAGSTRRARRSSAEPFSARAPAPRCSSGEPAVGGQCGLHPGGSRGTDDLFRPQPERGCGRRDLQPIGQAVVFFQGASATVLTVRPRYWRARPPAGAAAWSRPDPTPRHRPGARVRFGVQRFQHSGPVRDRGQGSCHQPGAAEPHLPHGEFHELERVALGGQPRQVKQHRFPAGGGKRLGRQDPAGTGGRLPQIGQRGRPRRGPGPAAPGRPRRRRGGPPARPEERGRRCHHPGDDRRRGPAPATPVRQRAVRILDGEQSAGQERPGQQPRPAVRRGQRRAAKRKATATDGRRRVTSSFR